MTKINVLLITSTLPEYRDEEKVADRPDFIGRLAEELSLNYNVAVVAPASNGLFRCVGSDSLKFYYVPYLPDRLSTLTGVGGIPTRLRDRPFRIFQVPFLILSQLLFLLKIQDDFRPDLIHAHWIFYPGFLAAILGRCPNVKSKIVITVHGSDGKLLSIPFLRMIFQRIIRYAELVTIVNPVQKSLIKKFDGDRVRFAPMGVDASFFQTEGAARDNFSILAVGRLDHAKGFHRLIYALEKLPSEYTLKLCGDGPEKELLVRVAKEAGVESRVEFLGWVSRDRLARILGVSGCFVLPSDSEGFSVSVIEAMARRVPVVVNKIPALEFQVQDGRGLVADARDPVALANKIVEACQCDAAAVERAFIYAQSFSWENVGLRYREIYQEAIK